MTTRVCARVRGWAARRAARTGTRGRARNSGAWRQAGEMLPPGVCVCPPAPRVTLAIQTACQLAGRGWGRGGGAPRPRRAPPSPPPRPAAPLTPPPPPGPPVPAARSFVPPPRRPPCPPAAHLLPWPDRPAEARRERARSPPRQHLPAPARGVPGRRRMPGGGGRGGGFDFQPRPPVKLGTALRSRST